MSTVEMTPPKPVQHWAADDYARKGRFVSKRARPVVDLLAPKRGECILDPGCGDGVLTEVIVAGGADVLGADLGEELLAAAAAKGLKCRGSMAMRCPSKRSSTRSSPIAALHWMRRPELVIAGVARALKPHGCFVGEFGGFGNVAAIATAIRVVSALRGAGDPAKVAPRFFPPVAKSRRLLEGGFTVKSIMLVPRPTQLDIGMQGWLETFGRSFFKQFHEAERTEVFSKVIELLRSSLCDAEDRRSHPALLCRRAGQVRQEAPQCPRHTHARFMVEALACHGRAGAIRGTPVQKGGA